MHHAVGMLVRGGRVARSVRVLKHPDPIVLEDDLVVLGIGDHGIQAQVGSASDSRRGGGGARGATTGCRAGRPGPA